MLSARHILAEAMHMLTLQPPQTHAQAPDWTAHAVQVLMQQRHTSSMSRSSFQGLMRGSYLEPGPLSPCKFRPTPQLTLSRPTIAAFAPAAGDLMKPQSLGQCSKPLPAESCMS